VSLLDRIKKEPSRNLVHNWDQATYYGGTYRGVNQGYNAIREMYRNSRCAQHDDLDPMCRFCLEAAVYSGALSTDKYATLLSSLRELGMLD
jgi:hypothetical protein